MQSTTSKSDVELSKTLSWILRHGAKKLNLPVEPTGYILIDDLLKTKELKSRNCTLNDIQRIVTNDSKNRYSLAQHSNSIFKIKANQGHSMQIENLDLKKIILPEKHPICVHGTYYKNWPNIQKEGLKRMNRLHIHFTGQDRTTVGISGFRENCQILIYIDLAKALADGIEFFLSENNVILSSGLNGIIHPKYFSKVIDRKTNMPLQFFSV